MMMSAHVHLKDRFLVKNVAAMMRQVLFHNYTKEINAHEILIVLDKTKQRKARQSQQSVSSRVSPSAAASASAPGNVISSSLTL